MSKKLLEGIRVVEIAVYFTGPLTTKALSDCGAEVIKIETKSKSAGGGAAREAATAALSANNTGKLSITLNFASPRGLELAHRLIAQTDIVVESMAGGTLKRRGLGYEDLKKIKPDIIMLSTCMQGQTGPYASHASSGYKLTALSGFNQIAGWPDREPGWLGPYTDWIAPRFNITAILAALDYRRRTGKGQYLDMSQNETGLQFMAPLILDYTVNQRVAGRMGNQHPNATPHNAYRCLGEDSWCAIAIFTDQEWQSFCDVIGNSSLAGDARFSTLMARKENEEELDRLVNEWTAKHTARAVMNLMQEAGVASGMLETAQEVMDNDPQFEQRRFFREINVPGAGKFRAMTGPHFLLSREDYEMRPGPVLGEHNEYVFKEVLGMSDEEIKELADEGVIG